MSNNRTLRQASGLKRNPCRNNAVWFLYLVLKSFSVNIESSKAQLLERLKKVHIPQGDPFLIRVCSGNRLRKTMVPCEDRRSLFQLFGRAQIVPPVNQNIVAGIAKINITRTFAQDTQVNRLVLPGMNQSRQFIPP